MRNKRAFINKPFDIAAGFILAIIAILILVTVYAIANSIDVDSAIHELNARESVIDYLSYEENGITVAYRIIHHPATKDKSAVEKPTTNYFEKQYNQAWTIIISYPKSYNTKDLLINKKQTRKPIATTYLPLPEGGYATIKLFFPGTVTFIPIGPGAFTPIIA